MSESPDIEFSYNDADSYDNEIAELYSYSEGPEFQQNLKAFEDVCAELNIVPLWQSFSSNERASLIVRLLDYLELCQQEPRMRAARAILYISQGCWGEVQSDREQNSWVRQNVFLLLRYGVWSSFQQLLQMEIDGGVQSGGKYTESACLLNCYDIRIILAVMYTMVETVRHTRETDTEEFRKISETFKEELGLPGINGELMSVTLLGMIGRFANNSSPQFPIRKVLLLLWKIILVTMGGARKADERKVFKRAKLNLSCDWEDTMEVTKTMRASSPPASTTELLEKGRRPLRSRLMKQGSLDESNGEIDLTADEDERPASQTSTVTSVDPDDPPDLPKPPPSPHPESQEPEPEVKMSKGLPWTPKVRQAEIDSFLDITRMKFVGYPLHGDRTTLAGLPDPVHEGVEVLKKHIYVSIGEVEVRKEEEITRNPMSMSEEEVDQSPAEIFYQNVLPILPTSMIALLKILLAAAPTSKSKTDSLNIMADLLPEESPLSVVQSMKLGLDINRHKEVLVKAVSAILLLLLKHLKANHIYQFEFMAQHLVFANCIPLILKFFNQNIMAYVQAKNSIALLDFPACVIGDPLEMSSEVLEASNQPSSQANPNNMEGGNDSPLGDAGGQVATTSFCCWRNMFSCINLLRILNKLTKWKHSRIMMLVVFKSAPILKRTLKVKHAMMQLYVLKLLKMQTKYLGRQWRKTNMKTLSAIYQKVRHRLIDDWAYGNDPDARPWDFQTEECALRACVDRFNARRYNQPNREPEFEPVDNCLLSVLGRNITLSDEFKKHYEVWVEQEVMQTPIDWDLVLQDSSGTN